MKIRFLQTVPSTSPGYPFAAGQIIDVPPAEEWLALLDGVRAEVVREVAVERAVAIAVAPLAPVRKRGRR